mmetsp:Transcript_10546/g.20769  ORF Transcript_10546/g.20769 Transcript_10546/m.20769 type:complete len:397 (-) Transcript_10546:486-1676(-)|eukprot:CAMPEP_0171501154 /NCGR_PEP_ID=MMETSP0958-20121227/9401_1 /TAXON_ID=87120 /ORGANISM="Aurantiochytrium limacinum, Strain ATCCMYA-1381" /LENGTH=396 /DNA_ID=CAMNT_0012035939 /DNA_START=255 /DNA_END=1445 /DNA_ORIENTATION=+
MAKSAKKSSAADPAAKAAAAKAAAAAKSKKNEGPSWLSTLYVAVGVGVLAAILAGYFASSDPAEMAKKRAEQLNIPAAEDRSGGMSVHDIKERAATLPCKNRHRDQDCHHWASLGHCAVAPGWMAVFCPASCNICELRDPNVRCDAERIGYDRVPALQPGSVTDLFSDLGERYPEYNITYLSKPPEGPWVVKFNNFLSDLEINTLIDQAAGGLKRSTDQGDFSEDGVQAQVISKGRTSENSWCDTDCEANPIVAGVMDRIAEITKVPVENFESFQLLRYKIGQEYTRHHDASASDNKLLSGPRIYTFFLYLSDVEEGGGTRFTDIKPPITNAAERGTAILWPSVTDEDPTVIERQTYHQALPVIKGTKLAANIWIHQYNYKVPNLHGCTGSFTEMD